MRYFVDDWASRALIRQYMRNSRATAKRKASNLDDTPKTVRKRQRTSYKPMGEVLDDSEGEEGA